METPSDTAADILRARLHGASAQEANWRGSASSGGATRACAPVSETHTETPDFAAEKSQNSDFDLFGSQYITQPIRGQRAPPSGGLADVPGDELMVGIAVTAELATAMHALTTARSPGDTIINMMVPPVNTAYLALAAMAIAADIADSSGAGVLSAETTSSLSRCADSLAEERQARLLDVLRTEHPMIWHLAGRALSGTPSVGSGDGLPSAALDVGCASDGSSSALAAPGTSPPSTIPQSGGRLCHCAGTAGLGHTAGTVRVCGPCRNVNTDLRREGDT